MELIEAKIADPQKVQQFLMTNESIQSEQLLKKGFVVEINKDIKGCFIIDYIDPETYWLRQLYMNQEEMFSLPLLIDSIIQHGKEKGIRSVYVHSHQQVVDELLSTLDFHSQSAPRHIKDGVIQRGKWWVYTI
ncbi:MAG TPA: hypothetical protein VK144_05485 [Bacillota bacterium]|nr:hypothetical protein [Bacillota bacterium]